MPPSTSDIIKRAQRLNGAAAFWGLFPALWEGVKHSVFKLETRQFYNEPEKGSYPLFLQGKLADAALLIPSEHEADLDLYADIRARGVEFVRCRPVVKPVCGYLAWEFLHYQFNAGQGEQIFCADFPDVANFLQTSLHHDFMVFDKDNAVIHDYDAAGLIQGGWQVTEKEDIAALSLHFTAFRAKCRDFQEFLPVARRDRLG